MNKLSCIVSGALLLTLGASSLLALNHLENPDFESGETPWVKHARFLKPEAVSFSLDAHAPHGGRFSAKIVNRKDNDAGWVQDVSVEPDRLYEILGWVKTAGVKSAAGSESGASLGLWTTLGGSSYLTGTAPWTPVRFFVKTGPGQRQLPVVCRLGFWGDLVRGTAWFDDLSAREATTTLYDEVLDCSPETTQARLRWSHWLAALVGAALLVWLPGALWKTFRRA